VWTTCELGHQHWGRRGAAGLLLTDPARTGVLTQKRAAGVHQGGTWALVGGAIDRGEGPIEAALREAHEEAGLAPDTITVLGTIPGADHGSWTYTYVLAEGERPPEDELAPAGVSSWEADRTLWVDLDLVPELRLHPGLRADWDRLAGRLLEPGWRRQRKR
jgi:8-oxo-dGTP diphosphatase